MRRIPLSVIGIHLGFAYLVGLIACAAVTDKTLSRPWAIVVPLAVLAVCTVWTSMSILCRKRVYDWLRPETRPRRWVLIVLMQLFAIFCILLLVGFIFRDTWITQILFFLFAIDFAMTLMTLKWFAPLMDRFVTHRGWDLR